LPTSNEKIRDLSVSRQVDLLRLAKRLGNDLARTLNRREPILRAQLRSIFERPRSDRPKAIEGDVQRVLRVLDAEDEETWAVIRGDSRSALTDLADDETRFLDRAIVGAVPVALALSTPSRRELASAIRTEPIDGAPLAQHLSALRRGDRERIVGQVRMGRSFNESAGRLLRRVFGTRSLRGSDGVREQTRRAIRVFGNTAANAAANIAKARLFLENRRVLRRELYVAVLDSRTTPICRSLDGQTFRVGVGPRPPLHRNCRSVRVPIVEAALASRLPLKPGELSKLEGRSGQIRRIIGPNPGKVTYAQWLTAQPAARQDEILGRTRGRLFRRGKLELGAFVDASGMQLRLDELRIREPAAFRAAGIDLEEP
jgi:SPP1 gp7 family putative phage head morphogenesis protein